MPNGTDNLKKKGSLLAVLQILIDDSDEDHYLTYNDIADRLRERYGILLARKAIGNDIAILQKFGYEIDKAANGIGVAYLERHINANEVRYLIDAAFSSRSIPAKEAKQLANKLSSTLSHYQRQNFSYLQKTALVNRTQNADTFYNIEIIQEAIRKKKKIKFQYLRINEDGQPDTRYNDYYYKVNPYYTVNNFGRYYLIANKDTHDNASNYRIDYMMNISLIEDSRIRNIHEIRDLADVSIGQYLSDHIYLFGGNVIVATLKVLRPYVLTAIKDWFGDNATITKTDEGILCTIQADENALFYWVRQYGENVEVLAPEALRERLCKELSEELGRYQSKENLS